MFKAHYKATAVIIFFSILLLVGNETAPPAYAHAYSVAFTRVETTDSKTTIQYSIDDLSVIESVQNIDSNKDYYLDSHELESGRAEILNWMNQYLDIELNGTKMNLLQGDLELHKELPGKDGFQLNEGGKYEDFVLPDAKIATMTLALPPLKSTDNLVLKDHFHEVIPSQYVNFVNLLSNDQIQSTTALFQNNWSFAVPNADKAAPGNRPASVDWPRFLVLGSLHILTGIDHLLFLLTLIVLKMRVKDYLKIITSFTVAHSLTLALSVLGIFSLPSKFVESMIAASIVFVALENLLFPKNAKNRWWLTFLFGLIHGLGFADLLTEMHLPKNQLVQSLLSFNVGIELTQLGLLAFVSPILWYWYKSRRYKPTFKFMNIAAGCIALVWVVQRVLA